MRASTVFVLALGLLVGFVALAAAKSAGLFSAKPASAVPPPPPPTKVLVAKTNLFEGVTATSDLVSVRELRAEEEGQIAKRFGAQWKDKLLPAMPSAVHLRTIRQNIPADTILFRDQFEEAELPESLSKRLDPNTRAVNVSVPKDKAAGGVLKVGEHVDVMLTTKVGIDGRSELRTANIARGCKIVMKRNKLWSVLAVDPDDKPLHFTLQANPYRAALIEYAQTLGQLALVPGSPPANVGGSYSDPTSKEYASEDQRIDEMVRGVRVIGTEDLVRVFQIPPRQPAAPPAAPPKRVQHLGGVSDIGVSVFPAAGGAAPAPVEPQPVAPAGGTSGATSPGSGTQPTGYNFQLPSATGKPKEECKSCEEAKRKAEEAKNGPAIRN